jgi:hypothetical protein
MLLIDSRRHVMSVTARSAPAPFLSLQFPNVQGVLGYLAPFRDDVWFVRALRQEMLVATGSVPAGGPHPARLIDEAARAVTRGRFQIAVELAGRIDVVFDPTRGYERPGFDVVAFASRSVAAVFLSDQLLDAPCECLAFWYRWGWDWAGVRSTRAGRTRRAAAVASIPDSATRGFVAATFPTSVGGSERTGHNHRGCCGGARPTTAQAGRGAGRESAGDGRRQPSG